jgi:hypothetical protein
VNGTGAGSYASELVISNYVSGKVVQIADKIKPTLLNLMKERLLAIDSSFPVAELDMKLELTMAASQMENVRQMTLMAAVPLFTENELRGKIGYEPLADDEHASIVTTKQASTANQKEETLGDQEGTYPETSMSSEKHTRDAAENELRKDEMSQVNKV